MQIENSNEQKRFDAKSIGIVIHKDLPNDLSEEDKEIQRQEPFLTKEDILQELTEIFHPKILASYVVAAERGTDKEGYHYQCCIKLDSNLRTRVSEYKRTIKGVNVYILYQKAKKDFRALVNYCRKDGDFLQSPDLVNIKGDMFESLRTANGDQETLAVLKNYMGKDCIKGDMKRMFSNVSLINQIETQKELHYTFPDHLVETEPTLLKWYTNNVIGKVGIKCRRRALVLFSEERAMGKTTFAKSIVTEEQEHYIICRNTFTSEDFKKPNAALLILDDMTYVGKQKEMWKALVSSEATSIRDAYCNLDFDHNMPTIVTTNDPKMFQFMFTSEYFKFDCVFYWVEKYLGPPGTNPREGTKRIEKNFDITKFESKFGRPESKNKKQCIEVDRNNKPVNSYFIASTLDSSIEID